MKKYIVAVWRMLTSKKWVLISIEKVDQPQVMIEIVQNNCDSLDYHHLGKELMDISAEFMDQMVDEVLKNSEKPTVVIPFPASSNN